MTDILNNPPALPERNRLIELAISTSSRRSMRYQLLKWQPRQSQHPYPRWRQTHHRHPSHPASSETLAHWMGNGQEPHDENKTLTDARNTIANVHVMAQASALPDLRRQGHKFHNHDFSFC